MKSDKPGIRTTHTGSLPRPPEILEAMRQREDGALADEAAFDASVVRHVEEIVARQVALGLHVVGDGECGKASFHTYQTERLTGFERRVPPGGMPVPTGPISPH